MKQAHFSVESTKSGSRQFNQSLPYFLLERMNSVIFLFIGKV